jgi:hypothetical protein
VPITRSMSITAMPSGLGHVRGVVVRARTLARGVYDIVAGERGLVLVPLWGPQLPKAAAVVVSGFQGGAIGHLRGGDADARRRACYLSTTADELSRHYMSHQTVRRTDVVRAHVRGCKFRLELNDGTAYTFRWERKANPGFDPAVLVDALGPAVEFHAPKAA